MRRKDVAPAMRKAENAAASVLVWGLPLLLVATVLATRALAPEFPGDETRFFRVMRTAPDLFNAMKASVLTRGMAVLGGVACVWLVLAGVRKQRPPGWLRVRSLGGFALLVAYCALAALAVVSTATSEYPRLARSGFWDHFEGWGVYVCYFAIGLLAFFCARARARAFRAAVTASMCAASLLVALVGAFQYAGSSPWEWPIFRAFVVAPETGIRVWSTWGQGAFSSTLYNPNWAGLFFSLVSPLAVFLSARRATHDPASHRNPRRDDTNRAARWAVLVVWVGVGGGALSASGSRSAFVATFASLLVFGLLALATRPGRDVFSPSRLCFSLAIFALGLLNVRSYRGASVATDVLTQATIVDTIARVERLESRGDALVASWHGMAFSLLLRGPGDIELRDERGRVVPWREEEGVLHALHPALLGFAVQRTEGSGNTFVLRFDSARVTVGFLTVGARVFHSSTWMRAETPTVPAFLATVPNGLANGRGFIWARGLALALDHPWLGVGPGAWADVFPQNDFAGKLQTFGTTNVTIEKPHNFYLGLAGTFGLPFLFVFLAMVAGAFARAFTCAFTCALSAWRPSRGAWPFALCASLASFSFAGLFNDSSIGVTPFFLVLLGCALGLRT